jgi:branched-chain amino acid aminotransferase
MTRTTYYHIDGEIVPAEEAVVSAWNRGLLYGDGFAEWLRVYGGQVFEWSAHERRIEKRCEALSIPVPEDLDERIEATLAANDRSEALIRFSVTRGGGPVLTPDLDADPVVLIGALAPPGSPDGSDIESNPVVVQTVTTRRGGEEDPLDERATRLRAHLELARAATDRYRAEEALLRDRDGFAIGGTSADLLFVDESALRVSASEPVSTLRPVVCDLAREEDIPVETGRYSPSAVREASEAFLANAVDGIRPVSQLDGIAVGDGPVTRLLAATLEELIESEYRSD